MNRLLISFAVLIFAASCGNVAENKSEKKSNDTAFKLFQKVDPASSGVHFSNHLTESNSMHFFMYEYLYNGGGVAVGDINNDGLPDLYFTGNMVDNKLYLNKGNLKFEDITISSRTGASKTWSTGATMADVNGDGFLDIYVCRSFTDNVNELRENLLYINNGDLTFTERGKAYGVNDASYSSQSTFLDYDLDGDLDLYVANHGRQFNLELDVKVAKKSNPSMRESDHLFRNNGDNTFTNVTQEAGLLNFGFSLGVVSSDINGDQFPDLYISNDYIEEDWLYINNGDGTFSMKSHEQLKHMSNFGMGVDLSDLNNDGLLDIMVLDMVAADNYRQKTNMSAMSPEKFWYLVDNSYGYQYMRNTLQINNGNGSFSEIGQLSGISNTDWSWAPVVADFDNDGRKDLFVTNGYRRDMRNNDFNKQRTKLVEEHGGQVPFKDINEMLAMIPEVKLINFIFRNEGDYAFKQMMAEWGLTDKSFSNGAASADLDNDGDLDLIVNNVQDTAFVYENRAIDNGSNHYLRVQFDGPPMNNFGLGAKVELHIGDQMQYQELTMTRGYQSSVEPILHFGLGENSSVDLLKVIWPDGKIQQIENVAAGMEVQLLYKDAESVANPTLPESLLFADATPESNVKFKHIENIFDDYEVQVLLPHKMSQFGPALASGDANGDGLDDFYIGGATGAQGMLYLQNPAGGFQASVQSVWENSKPHEELGAAFFDADNDGDQDLYVVCGGNEFRQGEKVLQDILYINNGAGIFTKSTNSLPDMTTSGSCVLPNDYDNDGDLDLFVAARHKPWNYPHPAKSTLLENNGGVFTDVTASKFKAAETLGMITQAEWTDINNDGLSDLIIVGEWTTPLIYIQSNEGFVNKTKEYGLEEFSGWWFGLSLADLDDDGDIDFVAGNLGNNYKYQASKEEPFEIYSGDFDGNDTTDIVLGYYSAGKLFPLRGRECSSQQIPGIKKSFPSYHEFASATLEGVYGDKLKSALHYKANTFASTVFMNDGNGKFLGAPLAVEAQFSSVNSILINDYDGDGKKDLLIAGNLYASEVETGRADASIGLLLKGNGSGAFKAVPTSKSGFNVPGDVRHMREIQAADKSTYIVVAKNNDILQIIRRSKAEAL